MAESLICPSETLAISAAAKSCMLQKEAQGTSQDAVCQLHIVPVILFELFS